MRPAFHAEHTRDGVAEYDFALTVDGERVPAVIWTPAGAKGPRPLVLMGHGGSQHKKAPTLAERAQRYARDHGWATLSIDAFGHGERVSQEEAAATVADIHSRVRGGERSGPSNLFKTMGERVRRIVPEWRAALDAAQSMDFIGAGGPVAYWGMSMGLVCGVPFVAAEPRITCAVLGLGGIRTGDDAFEAAVRAITAPVLFVFQWDDVMATREGGLALFGALGSAEKTMHINPGGHTETPAFEQDACDAFFLRRLGGRAAG